MRALLLFVVICALVHGAEAVCNSVIIDDFESATILNWRVLYGAEPECSITLSDFAHSGNYSVLLWNGGEDDADFTLEYLNTTFPQGGNYTDYNLSFWYFAECPFSGDSTFYMSHMSTFGSWSAVGMDASPVSCGGWENLNINIAEGYTWKSSTFSFEGNSVGSINIENPHSRVYYDDIMLIPSVPGTCCNESWSCTGWSKCYENNTQYRSCEDENSCGTEIGKPITWRECDCEPLWVCGAWGICSAGVRTRSCEDLNLCGAQGMPETVRGCTDMMEIKHEVSSDKVNSGEWVEITAKISGSGISHATIHVAEPSATLTSATMNSENGTYTYLHTNTSVVGVYRPHIEVVEWDGNTSWFALEPFTVFENLDLNAEIGADAYRQGDVILMSGNISDASGPVNCDLELRLSSGLWQKSLESHADGMFSFNYTIGAADPTGTWNVELLCTDGTRMGKKSFLVEVVEVVMFPYLSVSVVQPENGKVHYQGDRVVVTAQVRRSNLPISGATTFIVLPDGRRTVMDESGPGNYYAQFDIPDDSQTGNYSISIRSVQGNYFGENSTKIVVMGGGVHASFMEVGGPYISGGMVHIKVNLTRSDGSAVGGASLIVSTPDGNLSLVERGSGIYDAYYSTDPSYEGEWILFLYGVDRLEYGRVEVVVRQANLLDLLAQNIYLILLGIVASVLALVYFNKKVVPLAVSRIVKGRIERIKELQSELRESYFKLGDITRKAFNRRNREYEEKLSKLRKRLKQ